jgi:hypothetical protein
LYHLGIVLRRTMKSQIRQLDVIHRSVTMLNSQIGLGLIIREVMRLP